MILELQRTMVCYFVVKNNMVLVVCCLNDNGQIHYQLTIQCHIRSILTC
ncbi:hypothetical protein [Candidatus Hodgkinia cicadicola]